VALGVDMTDDPHMPERPAEQAKQGQAKQGQGKERQAKQGQAKQGQGKERQAKEGQAKQGQGKERQAKQGQAKQGQGKERQAKQGQAKQGQGKERQAEEGQAEEGQGKQGQAEQPWAAGDGGLELDLDELDARARYFLLTSVVVPRPIAWVSTIDAKGNPNLAPYSYFNVCSASPPIVHFTSTSSRDSIANVRETGEFVVNVVSADLAQAMRTSSAKFAAREDEFQWAQLQAAPSLRVRPPRVRGAKVALECRLRELLRMGEGTMAFGDVLHAHVERSVWRDGRVDPAALAPVGRLSGLSYTTVTDVYELRIPPEIEQQVEDYRIKDGPAGP
jgi:flavin reductase (DIM6/NTAB) family NADH-FMN oxidoreductase RutF